MGVENITFYENLLSVRNIKLKLYAKLSQPRSLNVEADGIIALGKTDYAVKVGRDPATNKYALTVETANLPMFDIVTAIGATFLPSGLQTTLKQDFQFNILSAILVFPFEAQPPQIQLSGTPGQKGVQLTAVAFKYSGKIRLIQKFDFGSFNIADLIKEMFGVSLHKLKILNQKVNINFLLSPRTIKGVKLSIPEFEGFSLSQGISIKAPLDWPSDCSSDAFCNVAQKLLGGVLREQLQMHNCLH